MFSFSNDKPSDAFAWPINDYCCLFPRWMNSSTISDIFTFAVATRCVPFGNEDLQNQNDYGYSPKTENEYHWSS